MFVCTKEASEDYAEEDGPSDDEDFMGDEVAAFSDKQRAALESMLQCTSLAEVSEALRRTLPPAAAAAGVARPRMFATAALAGFFSLIAAEKARETELIAVRQGVPEPWISAFTSSGGAIDLEINLGISLSPSQQACLVEHLPRLIPAVGVALLQEVSRRRGG